MMIKPLIALCALASATTAQAQATACITAPEAEALVLTIMPELIRSVGTRCAANLPAKSLLRTGSPLIARYRAEVDGAWPRAKALAGRLVGPEALPYLDSDLAKAMLPALVVPSIVQAMKPADCPVADRLATLLQPLPPRNAAALLVTIGQITRKNGNAMLRSLPLCPIARAN